MNPIQKIRTLFTSRRNSLPVPEFPPSILLEPTNACNLRCRMCPAYGEGVEKRRDIGQIERANWMRAIDEISSWPTHVNLDIHGAGEPLLHPEFMDILGYAAGMKNITVGFICNATLLDREKAQEVVKLKTDWVCFSVDGGEKEVFEYYRKGAVLETVEENIHNMLSLRKNGRPNISFNMVHHADADIDMFIKKWAGLVDSLVISSKKPVDRRDNSRLKLKKPCPLLYQQLVIGWPGKTGLCCEDYWGDYITGEFPSQRLYDIWHGEPLRRARGLHESFQKDRIDLCRTCDFTIFHQYHEETVEKDGRKTVVKKELRDTNPELAIYR